MLPEYGGFMSRLITRYAASCVAASIALTSAGATDITIPTGTTSNTGQTVTSGDSLTVEPGATLATSGGTQAVTITGVSGFVTINNAGTISQTGTARAVRNNTNGVTTNLNNATTGSITSVADDVFKIGQSNSGYAINNQGVIHQQGTGTASGQALDFRDVQNSTGNTITNGSPTNSAARIRADGDDALRPGANTAIVNYGTIITNGIVNTKCPDYLGAACTGKPSAHDAIDIGGRTNVSVDNFGTISGSRHGITADTSVEVINRADGLIVGRNGSGVGSDGSGTVINYGVIRGEYAGAGNVYEHIGSNGVTTANNGDGDGVDIDGIATIQNYGSIIGAGAGGVDNGNNPNGSDAIAAGGGVILNAASAIIRGQTNGVLIDDGSGGAGVAATSITNAGAIEGVTGYGIRIRGGFDNMIVNSGIISGAVGAVETGSGADTLDIRKGGRIVGITNLGGGADRLIIEGGSYTLAFAQTSGLNVSAPGVVAIGSGRVVVVDRSALPQSSAFVMMSAALDLTSRRADVRTGPASAATATPWQAWAQGFAYSYNGGSDGALPSWNGRMGGLAAGVDNRVDGALLVGVYIAAGRSDYESSPQDTNSTNVFGGVYGRWTPGPAFLDFGLSFGSTRDEGSRTVYDSMAPGGMESARAKRNGTFLSPYIGIGTHIESGGFLYTPALRLRYMAQFLDSYREAATNGMSVADNTLGLFEARAELAISRRFESGVTLRARLGALYDTQVSGDQNAASVSGLNLSLPMEIRGLGAGAFGSVGFAVEAAPGASIFAEAEGVAKANGVTGVGGRAGLLVRF